MSDRTIMDNIRIKFVRAFTLIELMISIALVVVLMIGITKVFSLTSNTAGSVNQLATGIRDARGAQTIFYNDLENTASDMPFMVIRSGTQAAFRNKADALSDRDGKPLTVDVDGNNVEGDSGVTGEIIKPTDVNARNHRIDVFSYFASGIFPRQTGNTGVYEANMSSQEAWIWYGHLQLPDSSGSFTANTDPGAGTIGSNGNNLYSSQWVLGREAIQLRDATNMFDGSTPQQSQSYIQAQLVGWPPFFYNSPAILAKPSDTGEPTPTLQNSRYDLLGTTISQLGQQLSAQIKANPNVNWWSQLMTGDIAGSSRFQADPVINKPLKSYEMAKTAPLFINSCSQFIVEYAGDYLQQDTNTTSTTYGQVENVYTQTGLDPATPAATDGQVDFVVQWNDANNNGLIDATEQSSIRRSIRWYGLPRDSQGNGFINGAGVSNRIDKVTDVVPLRDVIRAGGWTTITTVPATLSAAMKACNGVPFERITGYTPSPTTPTIAVQSNYAAAGSAGMQPGEYYECAWGPADPKPKMIRITMTIDDPSGKLPDGQTFQYVIQLH